jgi:cytochrome c peroxidase
LHHASAERIVPDVNDHTGMRTSSDGRSKGDVMTAYGKSGAVKKSTAALIGATLLTSSVYGFNLDAPEVIARAESTGEERATAVDAQHEGLRLFRKETFGGNGRTCETCHSRATGTLGPPEIQERLLRDPFDPLFLHDGLDDGIQGTSRITEHATIRVERPLPPNVRILEHPTATRVVLLRGIPSTTNTPALDPSLMYDLRARTLEEQALGAIQDHAQHTLEPTLEQLRLLADVQRTEKRFFSSNAVESFARGGPPPILPEGKTASQKRGRDMFVDAEFQPGSTKGICALCHSGPMLNRANQFALSAVGVPPNGRFADIGVSARNLLNLPVYTFLIDNGLGDVRQVVSPDPGVILTQPRLPDMPPVTVRHPAFFADMFKTPSLWNANATAPYFHDNHAKTLEEVAAFYADFFVQTGMVQLTAQDQKDMTAFLMLLR